MFISACQNPSNDNNDSQKELEKPNEVEAENESETDTEQHNEGKEETEYESIIKELKGIEKYYVQNDLLKLHSLLKHKKNERYKALQYDLEDKYEYPAYVKIIQIDRKNGYIKYKESPTECVETIVYWNQTNGDQLIGHVLNCCTMFCESDIDFKIYRSNSQSFDSKEIKEVIPEIDSIKSLRPDNHIEGDGFDYEFILPQNGKNIQFCLDGKCIDLVWKDGVFTVAE